MSDYSLRTIGPDGKVPPCRLKDARSAVNLVQRLIDSDQRRAYKRAQVNGLCDGNSPFNASNLRTAGRADKTNVNWGTGRSYLESGKGQFWDLFAEAPGCIWFETTHGADTDERQQWSRVMRSEADRIIRKHFSHDILVSQQQMVLAGFGPLYFEDHQKPLPRSMDAGYLLVPDRSPSDVEDWDVAAVLQEYYPPRLFDFIKDEAPAAAVGWNVSFTRDVIAHAIDQKQPDQRTFAWEWLQQEMKENSYNYVGSETLICRLAHVFWKEFDGRVTHAIIERTNNTPTRKTADGKADTAYLFLNIGQYEHWSQVIHPMYYDEGRAGAHHMVTGLGVKMFGAMRKENELLCDMVDGAMAPKTMIQCGTEESFQKAQITRWGAFGFLPPGMEVKQTAISGAIADSMAMYNATSALNRSNLSQYRQQVEPEKAGNPATAFEKRMQASQQGALVNTVASQYYSQLDRLYDEIKRRLCNINSSDDKVRAYQRACQEQGVPRECFGRVTEAHAVRLVGQGSPFMRSNAIASVGQVIAGCSEEGQKNWRDDYIAAQAGGAAVKRYDPDGGPSRQALDQKERAANQIVAMKNGMPATFSPSQNAVVFAGLYLQACAQAIQSVQKGAPAEGVVAFLDLAAPAAMQHIQRLAKDPMRKEIADHFQQEWERIAKLADQLKKMLAQKAKQAQAQQAKAQGVMSDGQIKAMKVAGDLALKSEKQKATLAMQKQKHDQGLEIADSRTASEIHNNRLRSLQE